MSSREDAPIVKNGFSFVTMIRLAHRQKRQKRLSPLRRLLLIAANNVVLQGADAHAHTQNVLAATRATYHAPTATTTAVEREWPA